jgi:hypothetical protein
MSKENAQGQLDPEMDGVPRYADDTSTAYDPADRPDFDDSPPPLPSDETINAEPGRVGRLVDTDDGGYADNDPLSVARDTGELAGLSAEEAAMHEVPDREVPYD